MSLGWLDFLYGLFIPYLCYVINKKIITISLTLHYKTGHLARAHPYILRGGGPKYAHGVAAFGYRRRYSRGD